MSLSSLMNASELAEAITGIFSQWIDPNFSWTFFGIISTFVLTVKLSAIAGWLKLVIKTK